MILNTYIHLEFLIPAQYDILLLIITQIFLKGNIEFKSPCIHRGLFPFILS